MARELTFYTHVDDTGVREGLKRVSREVDRFEQRNQRAMATATRNPAALFPGIGAAYPLVEQFGFARNEAENLGRSVPQNLREVGRSTEQAAAQQRQLAQSVERTGAAGQSLRFLARGLVGVVSIRGGINQLVNAQERLAETSFTVQRAVDDNNAAWARFDDTIGRVGLSLLESKTYFVDLLAEISSNSAGFRAAGAFGLASVVDFFNLAAVQDRAIDAGARRDARLAAARQSLAGVDTAARVDIRTALGGADAERQQREDLRNERLREIDTIANGLTPAEQTLLGVAEARAAVQRAYTDSARVAADLARRESDARRREIGDAETALRVQALRADGQDQAARRIEREAADAAALQRIREDTLLTEQERAVLFDRVASAQQAVADAEARAAGREQDRTREQLDRQAQQNQIDIARRAGRDAEADQLEAQIRLEDQLARIRESNLSNSEQQRRIDETRAQFDQLSGRQPSTPDRQSIRSLAAGLGGSGAVLAQVFGGSGGPSVAREQLSVAKASNALQARSVALLDTIAKRIGSQVAVYGA